MNPFTRKCLVPSLYPLRCVSRRITSIGVGPRSTINSGVLCSTGWTPVEEFTVYTIPTRTRVAVVIAITLGNIDSGRESIGNMCGRDRYRRELILFPSFVIEGLSELREWGPAVGPPLPELSIIV